VEVEVEGEEISPEREGGWTGSGHDDPCLLDLPACLLSVSRSSLFCGPKQPAERKIAILFLLGLVG
jgi:hypothetical protein